MRSRFLRVTIALVLLACFASPILESLDRWDHTLKTGQDTESTFVVLAVCAGAVISFAITFLPLHGLWVCEHKRMDALFVSFSNLPAPPREFAAVGEPPPSLRI